MKPVLVQEAVVAEAMGCSEKVLDDVSYSEARAFCEEKKWKLKLHGIDCKLKIVRADEKLQEFPEQVKARSLK